MLLSIPNVPVPPSSNVSYVDSHTDRSHISSLIPATVVPKHFNVPFAIQHGYFRCVRYLLELASDPNERDSQLRTPLILCSYVENDRWSLSLAQNLLEKGAKIALEDHARRNAIHHACALQRLHLVQLFLSCLDFNLQAKDCEGNTCLHYAAITGNCEIADLLMRAAEKINLRLDQIANREGCSAAVLALKYGHIECANQITHRDWDEFFVVPRPLSIYETPPAAPVASAKPQKKQKTTTMTQSKNDPRPLSISFGLLKIIFNEADQNYSTRLANICKEEKLNTRRRRKKRNPSQPTNSPKTQIDSAKSTLNDDLECCSTEALVNEFQRTVIEEQTPMTTMTKPNPSDRTSPRLQLLKQQYSIDESSNVQQDFNQTSLLQKNRSSSTLNQLDDNFSPTNESSTKKKRTVRPKTAGQRPGTSTNAIGVPSRLSSEKTSPIPPTSAIRTKKKVLLGQRASSASNSAVSQPHNAPSDVSTYSQTFYTGRPLSAAVQTPHPGPIADSSCSIREAKGAARRYNNPEELFGLKPEQLFATSDRPTPKIMNEKENQWNKRSQALKKAHQWQDDVDKLVDLYNIHHSTNYRPTAIPPPPSITSPRVPVDNVPEMNPLIKLRKTSIQRPSVSGARTIRLSSLASLNLPARNATSQRSTVKIAHT